MKKIYNIVCIPSLLLHELLHIVMTIVVFSSWMGIKIKKHADFNKTFGFTFIVFSVSKYRFQNTLIHLAPFFAFSLPLVFFFMDPYIGILVWLYQLITIPVAMPSKEDYLAIANYKTNAELIHELYE